MCVLAAQQAAAGEVPDLTAGPSLWETALPDSLQCAGSGLRSDGVLGGSLLLPPAASHWNLHADGYVLHQKGLKQENTSTPVCL